MAKTLRLVWTTVTGQFADVFEAIQHPMAVASTEAMDQLAKDVKTGGRANIRAGGFSSKWANALRVDRYPKRGVSINAALWIWHKIPYAGVFEQGASIHGKPMLWIPLSGMPKKIGGKRTSVASYAASVGPLVRVNRANGPPLLVGKPPSGMRKGRTRAQREAHSRFASSQVAPLFVGISAVTVKKHFSLQRFFEQASGSLVGYVAAKFRDDD